MLDIQPTHLTLVDLIHGRLFRIPEYQRSYSWTSRQRKELFADIRGIHEKGPDASHFMATVVCLRTGKRAVGTSVYTILDVVDGQQRLTTLILLLKAVQMKLRGAMSRNDRVIARDVGHLLVKKSNDVLLQTNHDSSHYFTNYIRKGKSKPSSDAKTIADRELLAAIAECQEFVENWEGQGFSAEDLVALLKNRLTFILYETAQESEVYTVFEILNSRGIAVSWLDRLKSILMGSAFELREGASPDLIDHLHNVWRDIYATVGLRQGMSTEALRFAATLQAETNKPLGEQASVDFFRARGTDTSDDIREVADWLLQVTKACDAVLADNRLNAVTRIGQARLLAVAIHLMDVAEADRAELLAHWERVSFRVYGMFGKDARTRVGEYVRLARLSLDGGSTPEDVAEGILAIGEEFAIEDAVDCLRDQNCYDDWQEQLRYMLYRYEEYLAKKEGINFGNEQWNRIWEESAATSIEHIWAQSRASEEVRHNLGNLMILPPRLNSRLKDAAFKEKRAAYEKTGLLDAQLISERRSWGKNEIKRRESRILRWAAEEWADF